MGFNVFAHSCSDAFYDIAHKRAIGQDNSDQCTYFYDTEPAGNPCKRTGVTLQLNQDVYHPGDTFICTTEICNNALADFPGVPLFVVLDVYGQFYFGPTWSTEIDNYLDEFPVLTSGTTPIEVLPSFTWPENCGTAHGIQLIAALTDPEIRNILGEYSMVSSSWSE